MNVLWALVAVLMLTLSSAIPLDMAKNKKGDETATLLNTDKGNHLVKRAKEMLMFGNQQNSPRIKKSEPEKELLSTLDKSTSSSEGETEEDAAEKNPLESAEENGVPDLLRVDTIGEKGELNHPDSDSDSDSDSDRDDHGPPEIEEEEDDRETKQRNKSGSSDLGAELESHENDDSQLLAVQSIPVPLSVDDSDKTLAELNKIPLDNKQTPLIVNQVEGEEEKELPELGELETNKPVDYDELLREYEEANTADFQRRQALHSSPFLNYIYRRRRDMVPRTQRTKRELLLPEDAEQYLSGRIPEKLVTLESWPNAYTESELQEKEAPYQIVNSPFDDNVGYGYQKRSGVSDETSDGESESEEDDDVPYEEVVLDGRPGYFIPAKKDFFPYAEEPVSHYGALVDKRRDEADYARLLRLARALAVQHDDDGILNEEVIVPQE